MEESLIPEAFPNGIRDVLEFRPFAEAEKQQPASAKGCGTETLLPK
jgi:hypothetical protein